MLYFHAEMLALSYIIAIEKEGRNLKLKSRTEKQVEQNNIEELETFPLFGYELIREILLPSILGDEAPDILYWAGKELARKFPLMTTDEIISFFEEAGWGSLTIASSNKKEMILELTGPYITRRLELLEDVSFTLESGFIAEQIQSQKKMIAEAFEEVNKRQKKVVITVRWDRKDRDV